MRHLFVCMVGKKCTIRICNEFNDLLSETLWGEYIGAIWEVPSVER